MSNKFLKRLTLFETYGGNMLGTGYYNTNRKEKNTDDGAVLFKLSPEGNIFDTNFYELDKPTLNLVLLEALEQKDGSILLIGEQRHWWVSPGTGGTHSSSSTYMSTCGDLLIMKIGETGKLIWVSRLPKSQEGMGIGGYYYSWFHRVDDEGSQRYLFFDTEKNIGLSTAKEPATWDGRDTQLAAYKLNTENGEVTRTDLLDIGIVNGMEIFQFRLNRIVHTAPKTIVFEAYKKNDEDILVKVNLD